jgi:hypothetical protein
MTPLQTNDFLTNEMLKFYPLGDIKLPSAEDLKNLDAEEGVL